MGGWIFMTDEDDDYDDDGGDGYDCDYDGGI